VLSAVLLDVGGTLWPDALSPTLSPTPILEQLAELLPGLEPAHALAQLRAALRDDDASLVQDTHSVLHRSVFHMYAGSSPRVDPVAIRRALCQPASAGIQLFAGAVELLACVRTLGLRCVVVSNVQVRGATEYWRDFADLGVAHCIDAVVTSLDVGYRKPHPAFFEAALRAANCGAESCVMIGNSELKDIQPAVALGMRAVRVAIEEPLPAATAAQAIASNLTEVGAILRGWYHGVQKASPNNNSQSASLRHWSSTEVGSDQVRGRDGVLDCQIDADATHRGHHVRGVPDEQQAWFVPPPNATGLDREQ
jgi:putative hydrolase of the HAD superfamily